MLVATLCLPIYIHRHVLQASVRAQWTLCMLVHFSLLALLANHSLNSEEKNIFLIVGVPHLCERGRVCVCHEQLEEWCIMEIICCCQSPLSSTCTCQRRRDTQRDWEESASEWHSEKVIKKSERGSTEPVECLKCVWHSNFPPLCVRKITSLSSHKAKWNGPDGENKNKIT